MWDDRREVSAEHYGTSVGAGHRRGLEGAYLGRGVGRVGWWVGYMACGGRAGGVVFIKDEVTTNK